MLSSLLSIKKGITSVIGGGGKTTLLHVLADELRTNGTVIITTTTHIKESDVFFNFVTTNSSDDLQSITKLLKAHKVLCIGTKCEDNKLSAPTVDIKALVNICDYVLIEADGSKGLPLKAHAKHEPVIPEYSTQTILVVGVDSIGESVRDTVHRPQIMCDLLGCKDSDNVTEKLVADLVNTENLHDTVLINKCDSTQLWKIADSIAEKINAKCVIASLLKGEWYVSSN